MKRYLFFMAASIGVGIIAFCGCYGESLKRNADQIQKFAQHFQAYGANAGTPSTTDNLTSAGQLVQMVGLPATPAPSIPQDYDTNIQAQANVHALQQTIQAQINTIGTFKLWGGIGLGVLGMAFPALGMAVSRLQKYKTALTATVQGFTKIKDHLQVAAKDLPQDGEAMRQTLNQFMRIEAEKLGLQDFGKIVTDIKKLSS